MSATEIKHPRYKGKSLFIILNVVGYRTFCKDLDYMNGGPIDRFNADREWDSLIERKIRKWDPKFLRAIYGGQAWRYRTYIERQVYNQVSQSQETSIFLRCN
jgi:hypothetical protein